MKHHTEQRKFREDYGSRIGHSASARKDVHAPSRIKAVANVHQPEGLDANGRFIGQNDVQRAIQFFWSRAGRVQRNAYT